MTLSARVVQFQIGRQIPSLYRETARDILKCIAQAVKFHITLPNFPIQLDKLQSEVRNAELTCEIM